MTALTATRQAAGAVPVFAPRAAVTAVGARAGTATFADDLAVAAKRVIATRAGARIVFVQLTITIVTRYAVPLIELDVGRSGRIGMQDPIDDRKEIAQSAFLKCSCDRRSSFAGTEPFVMHMRMRRARVGTRRVRFQSDDLVSPLIADSLLV